MSSNIAMLGKYTSLGVGGPSGVLILKRLDEAADMLREVSVTLGRGSNVLVSDGGLDGNTLINRLDGIICDGETLYAQSGVALPRLAGFAAENGLSGLEWACGIPGSVGGAVIMNAGAYGSSISDRLAFVEVLRGGKVKRLLPQEIRFSYRKSNLEKGDFVLGAALRLSRADKQSVTEKMRIFADRRKKAQPKGKTAGSTFIAKDKPAWVYIDGAGLRGAREGGAFVSEKHANFIMNDGTATATQVYRLIRRIEQAVFEKYGVSLEREIIILGSFNE